MNKWLKTALVAGGGVLTAGVTAIIDPSKFNFRDGADEGHIAEMFLEGAAVAAAGIFLRTPLGLKAMQQLQKPSDKKL